MAGGTGEDVTARARAWRTASLAAVCDVLEPWEHGTIARATRYPSYYDFNLVRVEGDPDVGVDELVRVADAALDGLSHRRLDFDVAEIADGLRPGFEAIGWKTLRLLWMRHAAGGPAAEPELEVEEVEYDEVHDLRVSWYREEAPEHDPGHYHQQAREVALRRRARVLAVRSDGRPVAFAQLEHSGDSAEITQVFVERAFRAAGRGTAMTTAAIAAAGDVRDLWIAADDEDRAKHLYERLGFRAAWTAMEVTRWPEP